MKTSKNIEAVCEWGMRILGGGILFLLMIANFLFTSYVSYQDERVSIEPNKPWYYLITVLFFVAATAAIRRINRLGEKKLFLMGTAVTIVVGLYWIANADEMLRFDPLYVYETANELSNGNFRSLYRDGYLHYFPHQLGMVTYERIVLSIATNTKLLFILNLLEMIGINFFLWKDTNLIFHGKEEVNCGTILLSFLFLPQFFFILFAYGLIPGFFCMMVAYYYSELFVRTQRRSYFVIVVLFCCIAVFLKKNFLIGIIALAIWSALQWLKYKKYWWLVGSLLLVPCCIIFLKGAKGIGDLEAKASMGDGVPAMFYIGMGMNPNNEALGPGWFDGTNWSYYTQYDQDTVQAKKYANELMGIYFGQMKEDIPKTAKFFVRKMISIWCDPLFQSVWSGPLESCGQQMASEGLQKFYRGEGNEPAVYGFMKAYVQLLLLFSFLYVCKYWKTDEEAGRQIVFLIGGFLFHMMWEAKSQYVYPYLFLLIPMFAYMLWEMSTLNWKEKIPFLKQIFPEEEMDE